MAPTRSTRQLQHACTPRQYTLVAALLQAAPTDYAVEEPTDEGPRAVAAAAGVEVAARGGTQPRSCSCPMRTLCPLRLRVFHQTIRAVSLAPAAAAVTEMTPRGRALVQKGALGMVLLLPLRQHLRTD